MGRPSGDSGGILRRGFAGSCVAWLAGALLLAGASPAQEAGGEAEGADASATLEPNAGGPPSAELRAVADALVGGPRDEGARTRRAARRERRAARSGQRSAQHSHASAEAAKAIAVLRRSFPELLAGLRADPLALAGNVTRFTSDYTAVVRLPDAGRGESGGAETALVESTLPLRAETENGRKREIDLALTSGARGFTPKLPLVPLRLPLRAGDGAVLPEPGIKVGFPGARSGARGLAVGDEAVLYPNTARHTDLLAAPIQTGVEVLWQLRSARAPERFVVDLGLPAGTELAAVGGGAAEVRRDGETIAFVPAPATTDRTGASVPTRMSIAGDRLNIRVPHHARSGLEYPLIVDPVLETYTWWQGNATGLSHWSAFQTPDTQYDLRQTCNPNWGCYGSPSFDRGLYIYGRVSPPTYQPSDVGRWFYRVPRYPNSTAYISRFDYSRLYFNRRGSTAQRPRVRIAIFRPHNGTYYPNSDDYLTDVANASGVVLADEPGPDPPVEAKQANFELVMTSGSDPLSLDTRREAYLGGAVLYLRDSDSPRGTVAHQGRPSDWVEDANPSVALTANDPGLGVNQFRLTLGLVGEPITNRIAEHPCSGGLASPCPTDWETTFDYSDVEFAEGVHVLAVWVEDAEGRTGFFPDTEDQVWDIKIDRSPPVLDLGGPLRQGEEGPLEIDATDGEVGVPNAPNETARSGIASLEVLVDGEQRFYEEQPCTSEFGSCPMSRTLSPEELGLDAWNAFADFEVEVIAKDQLGHESRERWMVDASEFGDPNPKVERFTGPGVNEWSNEVGERSVQIHARDDRRDQDGPGGDRGVEAIRLAIPSEDFQTHQIGCGGADGCPAYAGDTFDYSTAELEDGITTAAARAKAPDGNVSKLRTFGLKIDRVAPAIGEFTATPAVASGTDVTAWDITISATDPPTADEVTSGVRRIEFHVGGERRRVFTQPCDEGGCPFTKTFRYTPAREDLATAALPEAAAVAVDGASNVTTDDSPDVEPVGPGTTTVTPGSRLGLEQYFQYDSHETGLSGAHVNLANGNAVWHKVPVVNPGRGLSSVVNLTYNAHDFPLNGLLDLDLGQAGNETKARLSNMLAGLGLGYDEAGPGFSLGISGLSRVNEPLKGLFTAAGPGAAVVVTNTPGAIVLTDPDGTTHEFKPKADAPSEFDSPPGVDLRLRFHSFRIEPHKGEPGATLAQNFSRSWAFTRPDGVTYFYDSLGYARSIVDRNGNTIRFDYDLVNPVTLEPCAQTNIGGTLYRIVSPGVCEPRLAEVVDPAGVAPGPTDGQSERMLEVEYWAPGEGADAAVGKVRSVTDHEGRELRLAYDNGGRLTSLTEAFGTPQARTTSFAYDLTQPLQVLGELGHPQITRITDPRGNHTNIAYEDGPTALLEVINQLLGADLGSLQSLAGVLPDRRVEVVTNRRQNSRGYAYEPLASTENTATVTTARPTSDSSDDPQARTTYEYELDHADRLEAIVDPLGRRTELDWSQDNRVNRLTEAAGSDDEATTLYSYNENGALLSLTDPLGRTTELSYRDGAGPPELRATFIVEDDSDAFVSDLTSIRRPSGATWSYGLDEPGLSDGIPRGNVTSETDPLSNTTTHSYDSFGQVAETINAEGDETEFRSYDANGLPTEIISPRGAEEQPLDHRFLYLYDGAGNLIQSVDPRGAELGGVPQTQPLEEPLPDTHPYTTTLTFDPLDRLTTERLPKCSNAGACGEVEFSERSYTYDPNDNVVETTDATGAIFETDYTAMDRASEERRPAATGGGGERIETQLYAYDPEESLTEITSPRATEPGTTREHITRFVLDDAGRRLASVRQGEEATDDLVTSYSYDARDNVTGVALPRDNAERTETAGVPAYETVAVADAIDRASDPAYLRAEMSYDAADQLLSQVEDPANPDPDGPEGPEEAPPGLELRTEFTYDANGNTTREIGPRGFAPGADPAEHATFYDYDPRDLLTRTTDPVGSRTNLAYDSVGRLTSEERPNGAATDLAGDFTVNYSYNPNGELERRTIPLAEGQYGKDSEEEMDDFSVSYQRDPVGNPVAITDGRGNTFQNGFFDSGQIATTGRPSWWSVEWGPSRAAPDTARRFRSQPSGAVADTMVPMGGPQVSEAAESGGMGGEIGAEEKPPGTAPTDFGEVEPEVLPVFAPRAGETTFDYDDELRLTRVTDSAGHDRRLLYDPQGRITEKRLPYLAGDPIVHSFAYDRNGNLTASTDGEGHTTTYAYDPFDRLQEEDAPGSVPSKAQENEPAVREITAYRYDPNGSLERRLTPRFENQERLVFDFRYDPLDRLVSEQNPASESFTYTYDPASNVATETTPRGNETTFSYDSAQRLTAMTEADETEVARTTRFSYDPNGNRILIRAPGAQSKTAGFHERTTCSAHDGSDRPWKTTLGASGTDDDQARTTITEYDAQGNLRRVVNPPGVDGHCFGASPQVADPDPQGEDALLPGQSGQEVARDATVAHYDEDGLLRRRYLPFGDNAPGGVQGGNDINGVDQQAENRKRYVQRFDYELGSPGWLQTVTEPYEVGTGAEIYATSYQHHPSGWFESSTDPDILRPGEDAISGRVVSYTYDKRGTQTAWETRGFDREEQGGPVPPDERKVRRSFYPSGLLKQRTGIVTGTADTEKRRYEYFYNRNRSLSEVFDRIQDSIAGSPLGDPYKLRTIGIGRDRAERETLIDEQWSGGKDTLYAYDPDGNLARRRVDGHFTSGDYQGGRRTDFTYDELSRETEMAVDDATGDPGSPLRTWETSYHPSGEIDVLEKPNGTTETHRFRADGLIESIERESDSPDPNDDKDQVYAYDPNGNRTQDERGTYAYNARSQLAIWDPTGSGEGNEPTSYVLNGSGQISEERSADLDTTFSYAGHRLLTREVDPSDPGIQDATYRYRYDDFGNTTRIVGPGAGTSEPPPDITGSCAGTAGWTSPDTAYFCWDEFSRLTTSKGAETNRNALAVYIHDGLDRRDFRITSGAGATEFFKEYSYVGLTELLAREQRDLTAAKDATYDYNASGRRLAQRTQGDSHSSRRYYATDAQGSVEALESPSGEIAQDETYSYDPYGALDQEGDPTSDPEDELSQRAQSNPFRFMGHYYDAGIRSYDMRARQYAPEEGRFLSQDVFASAGADLQLQTDPLTQNRYVFAGGNPVSRIEWDGHCHATHIADGKCGPGGHKDKPGPSDQFGNPIAPSSGGASGGEASAPSGGGEPDPQAARLIANAAADAVGAPRGSEWRRELVGTLKLDPVAAWETLMTSEEDVERHYSDWLNDPAYQPEGTLGDRLAGSICGSIGLLCGSGDPRSREFQAGLAGGEFAGTVGMVTGGAAVLRSVGRGVLRSTAGGSVAPKVTRTASGLVTNGRYTIKAGAQARHTSGSTTSGRSQFLFRVDAEQAVLDAAAYADETGLWVSNKAKVFVENGPIGVLGTSGRPTSYINLYRTNTGFVHGAPGRPPG